MSKTIRELTEDLLAAPSACAEVKETAQNYLDAIGGENEAAAAKTFVAELEEDIMPIDGLIAFAESDMGAKVFGEEGAKKHPDPRQRDQIQRSKILRLPCMCSV